MFNWKSHILAMNGGAFGPDIEMSALLQQLKTIESPPELDSFYRQKLLLCSQYFKEFYPWIKNWSPPKFFSPQLVSHLSGNPSDIDILILPTRAIPGLLKQYDNLSTSMISIIASPDSDERSHLSWIDPFAGVLGRMYVPTERGLTTRFNLEGSSWRFGNGYKNFDLEISLYPDNKALLGYSADWLEGPKSHYTEDYFSLDFQDGCWFREAV